MDLPEGIVEALERERDPAYLLDREGRILFINDAWDRCARANGGPPEVFAERVLGTQWLDGMHGRVRRYYRALLHRAFSLPHLTRPFSLVHMSECNTPAVARTQATRFIPLYAEDDPMPAWMLVVHCIVSECALEARHALSDRGSARFEGANGIVTQCGCCRRVRVVGGEEAGRWELVPSLLARPHPKTSHGLCGTCFEAWYGQPEIEPVPRRPPARPRPGTGVWVAAHALPLEPRNGA